MDYNEVYNVIKEKLDNGIPFSLSRLGDGESLVLHCVKEHQPRRMSWFLTNQFGYIMEADKVLEIKELILEGYRNADIIGMPTTHHRESCGAYWTVAEEKLNKLAPETIDIDRCSIDVHSELLESGLLHKLIESQDEIVCIFGRSLNSQLKKKFNLKNVYSYKFTPEQRYEVNRVQSKYYPKEYNEALEFINNTDCKGKLCLVACGMLGKNLTYKLKQAGGIAIDIGHVPDAWAGKQTRGAGKGATAENNTYKL